MNQLLTVDHSAVTGTPVPDCWSRSLIFEPENDEIRSRKGRLYVVLTLNSDFGLDCQQKGHQLLEGLKKYYFEDDEPEILTSLKKSLEKVAAEENSQVAVSAAVVWGRVLNLASFGKSLILLKRGQTFSEFFKEGRELDVKTLAGTVLEGDVLVLATKLEAVIEKQEFLELIDNHSPGEISEAICPIIQSSKSAAAAAALFLQFKYQPAPSSEEESLNILDPSAAKLPRPKIRLKTEEFKNNLHQRRFLAASVLGLLALFLFVNIGRGLSSRRLKAGEDSAVKDLRISQEKYLEAKNLADLNPARAESLLSEAQNQLNEAGKNCPPKNTCGHEVEELGKNIVKLLETTSRTYKDAPEIFFDLSLIKEQAVSSNWSDEAENLYLLDKELGVIYLLNLKTKSSSVYAGSQKIKELNEISFLAGKLFGFNAGGIYELKGQEAKEVLKNNFGGAIDFKSYSGNLYFLDKSQNQIFKYSLLDDGFSSAKNYLSPNAKPDFSEAISLAIDGSIWTLSKDAINRFTSGQVDPVNITGLKTPITDAGGIYTNENLKNIYILEAVKKRIVILDKRGQYQGQFQNEAIGETKDIFADEEMKKIFLLNGDKIYFLNLR